MECNRQNFLTFWTIVCPFTPPNNPENQNFEKNEKTAHRYYHFTQVYYKSKSYAGLFRIFSTRVWQNARVNTVRRAMV